MENQRISMFNLYVLSSYLVRAIGNQIYAIQFAFTQDSDLCNPVCFHSGFRSMQSSLLSLRTQIYAIQFAFTQDSDLCNPVCFHSGFRSMQSSLLSLRIQIYAIQFAFTQDSDLCNPVCFHSGFRSMQSSLLSLKITQSLENHRRKCHRYWLRLRHVVILISNTRILASVKVN